MNDKNENLLDEVEGMSEAQCDEMEKVIAAAQNIPDPTGKE